MSRTLLEEKLNFSWIDDRRVAGCRGPRSESDLQALYSFGIRALVRLEEPQKAGVTGEQVRELGIEDISEPVPDWTAPRQDQIDRIVEFVSRAKDIGKAVAISCGAGYGRTGTLLACILVDGGRTAGDAIDYLICVRPVAKEILSVPGQKAAVFEFACRRTNMTEQK